MQRRPSRLRRISSARGYKIIAGTASRQGLRSSSLRSQSRTRSSIISGPAAVDAVTGINKYTFRSGRQTYQDVKASTAFLKGAVGKNVVVLAQDIAFGQGNFAVVRNIFGDLSDQKVDRVLVPFTAQDFTPYAQQLQQKNPDLVFVAWAGTTGPRCGLRSTSRACSTRSTRSSPASPSGRHGPSTARRSGRSSS